MYRIDFSQTFAEPPGDRFSPVVTETDTQGPLDLPHTLDAVLQLLTQRMRTGEKAPVLTITFED